MSTDPAHSLGDALDARLTATPARVGQLYAVELDAPRAFKRWIDRHGAALGDALEHGTWLDRADVEALLDLSLPGIDELAGMLEITRLSGARGAAAYDLVVVDTAPTGHTLRLLAAPRTVAAVADILDALQEEHRVIRQQLARVGRPEAADRLIAELADQARECGELLRDPKRTTFCWVTLAEALSLEETEDAVGALRKSGIRAAEIIVNRVLPDGPACPICDRRRDDQARVLAQIKRRLGRGRRLRVVPAELREPRGVRALTKIGQKLSTTGDTEDTVEKLALRVPRVLRGGESAFALSAPKDGRTVSAESLDVFRGATLVFVGGKGGVGKTTVSAAAAVRLARAHPNRRMLLMSTDPAHSLADVFNQTGALPRTPARSLAGTPTPRSAPSHPNAQKTRVGDPGSQTRRARLVSSRSGAIGDAPITLRGGPPNLFVRELDAAQALAARRIDLEEALDDIASALGSPAIEAESAGTHVSVRAAPASAASQLMDLAPPGVDELLGILEVLRLTSSRESEYDVIVIDTAPTGHALRLLELPDAAREWVQVLLRMLLKYKSLVRPGRLAAELVDVSKSIRDLQKTLRDRSRTRFLVVTRAAEVPRLETERLFTRLRTLKLAAPALIVNAMTLAPRRCPRCRMTASAERRSLAALQRWCGRRSHACDIIQTPLAAPPPRGAHALAKWAQRWLMAMVDG